MTPGAFNLWAYFYISIVAILLLRLLHSIVQTILLGETVLSSNLPPVRLSGLGANASEILGLTRKNLAEFISICSVKEVPKIVLPQLVLDSTDTLEFVNIPIPVLKTCFIAEQVPKQQESIWRLVFGNHPKTSDGYSLLRDTPSREEKLIERVRRVLAPYKGTDMREGDSRTSVSMGNNAFILHLPNQDPYYFPNTATFPKFNCYQETPIYGFEDGIVECMICCDANVSTVLLSCCHASTCESCANSLRDGKCPICRAAFTSKVILPIIPRPTSRISTRSRPSSLLRNSSLS